MQPLESETQAAVEGLQALSDEQKKQRLQCTGRIVQLGYHSGHSEQLLAEKTKFTKTIAEDSLCCQPRMLKLSLG